MNHPLVVHNKKDAFDVYIGRPSKWGNPFTHINDKKTRAAFIVENRDAAVTAYEVWIRTQPNLMKEAKQELKGKVLGCWCSPMNCHGNILACIANEE